MLPLDYCCTHQSARLAPATNFPTDYPPTRPDIAGQPHLHTRLQLYCACRTQHNQPTLQQWPKCSPQPLSPLPIPFHTPPLPRPWTAYHRDPEHRASESACPASTEVACQSSPSRPLAQDHKALSSRPSTAVSNMQWSATSHIPPSTPCTTVHRPSRLPAPQPRAQNGAKAADYQNRRTAPGVAVALAHGVAAVVWNLCPAPASAT